MHISGRTAIVTGGASGIGRAAALQLASRGAARIALIDIDEVGLAHTARLIGDVAESHMLDLGDLSAVETWFSARHDADILFNNAGVVSGAPQFPEAPPARLQAIVNVNLTALVLATQITAQGMRAHGGGVIVNTVSTVALGTGFRDALYATTKAGVMMFTRCCASLAADWNVRVGGVLPGLTDTPILFKTGADGAADWMAPVLANTERCTSDDIADAFIDLVEDDTLAGGDWVAVRRVAGRIERLWGHADTVAA